MKLFKQICLGVGIVAVLAAAGCKAAPTAQVSQNGSQAAQAGVNGTQGIITEVSGNSITIAVMPAGIGPQGGGNNGQPAPQGSGSNRQPPAPSGSIPQGGAPQASSPAAAADTSSWQKQTFTIDSKTTITQGQAPGSSSTSANTLTAADLKTGESVSIAARSGQATVAGTITVMQGMGNPPGGQGGNPAPAATSK